MSALLDDFATELWVAAVGAVVTLFVWGVFRLARFHPLISLVLGLAFLAVSVAEIAFLERKHFQSDGSAAGLVIFAGAAVIGLFFGVIGLMLLGSAIKRLLLGKADAVPRSRLALGVFGGMIALGIAVGVGLWSQKRAGSTPMFVSAPDEHVYQRATQVRDQYTLAWKRRGFVPAVTLAVPKEDLAASLTEDPVKVGETRDGPRGLALLVADPEAGYARLTLHRDDSTVPLETAAALHANRMPYDPAPPRALWIRKEGAGFVLLGFDCGPETLVTYTATRCHEPQPPLARWVPSLFKLERWPLHATNDGRRGERRCETSFRYRDRVATLENDAPCYGTVALSTVSSGVQLLGRLSADTAAPPNAQGQLDRAGAAVASCEGIRKAVTESPAEREKASRGEYPRGLEAVCQNALRRAAGALRTAPVEATQLMVRAIEAQGTAGFGAPLHLLDAMVDALHASGKTGTPEAIRAHTARLSRIGGGTDPRQRSLTQASLDVVFEATPRVAGADGRLFESVDEVVGRIPLDKDNLVRYLALLKAWEENTRSGSSSAEGALKARHRACRARIRAGLEREALGGCADDLFAEWGRRVAANQTFDLFYNEAELAFAIAGMYYGWSHATENFAAGSERLQRVRDTAAVRLTDARYAQMLAHLKQLHEEIAAKARPAALRAR